MSVSAIGDGVTAALHMAINGLDARQQAISGNVLELETMRLEVAEACSGIRSIVSLFAFGLIVGRFGGASPAGLGVLTLATVPIAVLANAARVAGTGLAAHVWGSAATEGAAHGLAGALVFMGAAAGLLAVHRLTGRLRVVAS